MNSLAVGVTELPIDSVVVRDEFYPRKQFDNETVNRYRQALDKLPPISVNRNMLLVDGYHRLMAHKVEQHKEIAVVVEDVPDDQVLWESVRRNAAHGLQLSAVDKRQLAQRFFDAGRSIDEIALVLSVQEDTVRNVYLIEALRKRREQRNRRIIELYSGWKNILMGDKYTETEIAEIVSAELGPVSRQTVSSVINTQSDKPDHHVVEMTVVEGLGARHTGKSGDGGIDGVTGDTGIQVTTQYSAGRPKVDAFVHALERQGLRKGILVAPRLTKGAEAEIARATREKQISVEYRPLSAVLESVEIAGLPENRRDRVFGKYLAGCSVQEVAVELGVETSLVERAITEKASLVSRSAPDSLQVFNVWNFQTNDDRYGIDYPGRIPGQILENLLYYYTESFATVVDPMGGGGTMVDVCKTMYRRYRVYDINPVRQDIKKHDITEGFPAECRGADFIFMDPPYWSQKKGEYSDHATNLANLDLQAFYGVMCSIIDSAHKTLKPGGHIAIIIGPTQERGRIYDHAFEIAKLLEQRFEFANRIIVPYTTQQAKAYHVADAKDGRYMLKLYRDLLVYRKTEVNVTP